ncbi:MAG: biopolymer transporter ExbD [Phormidesmis sp.]
MKIDLENRQSDVQIEILPMIDVIFCILTFFILAAVGLTRQQAIALDLPAVNNSSPVDGNSRDRLYVSVDSAGQVYVDKSAVPLGLLYDVLVQHQQIAPNGTIVLYASRSARYEDVVKVLDLLRTVGGDRVALATLPNDASLDPTQGKTLEEVLQEQGVPIQPGQPGQPGIPGSDPFNGQNNGNIPITPAPNDGQFSDPNGLPPISPTDPISPNAPAAPTDPSSTEPASP